MVEVLVAAAFLTATVAALSRRSMQPAGSHLDDRRELDPTDLPCPWCQAATREEDRHCPGCGQRFG